MDNDDLRRRLEKLVALKEHPSTLPAIRAEAARAAERLRAHIKDEAPPGTYRRYPFRPNSILERCILRDLDMMTKEMRFTWTGIVGVDR